MTCLLIRKLKLIQNSLKMYELLEVLAFYILIGQAWFRAVVKILDIRKNNINIWPSSVRGTP